MGFDTSKFRVPINFLLHRSAFQVSRNPERYAIFSEQDRLLERSIYERDRMDRGRMSMLALGSALETSAEGV